MSNVRIEHDLLGDREVPADAYYGVHTLRAMENFPISGTPISAYPDLISALACVKQAAAQANGELGLLDAENRATRSSPPAARSGGGTLHDQFVVDVIQGGAGTSTNMNANEVICQPRARDPRPPAAASTNTCTRNEHVNLAQSTNDVYPTAVRLATLLRDRAAARGHGALRDAFEAKAEEFARSAEDRPHAAAGRGADDARPGVLDLRGDARRGRARLTEAAALIHEINLGATAIGTGINAPSGLRRQGACRAPARDHRAAPVTAPNLIEATQDCGAFVQLSGVLKRIAVKLSKTCNDLRLLSSRAALRASARSTCRRCRPARRSCRARSIR